MKKTVYAYLHTHWDREWYRNKQDFNVRLQNVFDIVLDELNSNRVPFFYFDGQVLALIDYLKYNPSKKELVKKLIIEKKLAIGPYFVSADSYLSNFPLMLKNLELGLKISKEYNQKEFIGYMSDIFGISKSAFKALEIYDINKAMIWRGVNPELINNNCNFKYGNINTLWLSMGYFNDFVHNNNIEGLKNYIDKIFQYSGKNSLLPIGADHLGMLKNANKVIKEINNKLDDYEIILTNPFEYFKKNSFNNNIKCEEFLDNKVTYTLQGVYSTRIDLKIKNHIIQNKLSRIVEPLNYFLKEKYDSYIDETYEMLLKNQAHDSICLCSLDSVANNVNSRFDKCNQMLDSLLLHILNNFKNKYKIEKKSKNKIGLFNLSHNKLNKVKIELPYILDNAQVIETKRCFNKELLADCYKIPVTEDICNNYVQLVEIGKNDSFGFNTVKIQKPKCDFIIKENLIENKFISLKIKNKNIILTDKKNSKKAILKLTNIKDKGDSYNFAPYGKRKELPLLKSEILYIGKIQSALRLFFKGITLDVIIDSYSKFIKFEININNKEKNHKLQLNILSEKDIKKTTAHDAIGTIERIHNPNYKMEDYMPCKRPIELKTNSYPMQNFVNFNGINVLTKGLNEYEIYKNELRICLLRSIGVISNPKNPARAIPAGPELYIPNAQLQGKIKAEFAILFGNIQDAYSNIDEFMENYATMEADSEKDINIKFYEVKDKTYFYGMSGIEKIIYNIKEDKIALLKKE